MSSSGPVTSMPWSWPNDHIQSGHSPANTTRHAGSSRRSGWQHVQGEPLGGVLVRWVQERAREDEVRARRSGPPAAAPRLGRRPRSRTQRRPSWPWASVGLATTAAAALRATWRSTAPVADATLHVAGELEHAGVDTAVVGDPSSEAVHHDPGELATVATRRSIRSTTAQRRSGSGSANQASAPAHQMTSGSVPLELRGDRLLRLDDVGARRRPRPPWAGRRPRRDARSTVRPGSMSRPTTSAPSSAASHDSSSGGGAADRRRPSPCPRLHTYWASRRQRSEPVDVVDGRVEEHAQRPRPPPCGSLHVAIRNPAVRRGFYGASLPLSGIEKRQKRQTGRPVCRRAPRSVVRTGRVVERSAAGSLEEVVVVADPPVVVEQLARLDERPRARPGPPPRRSAIRPPSLR